MAGPFAAPRVQSPPTRAAAAPLPVARAPERDRGRGPAPWWVVVEAGAVALVLAVVGGLAVASNVVVDWREPVTAGILLLTPFFVWYVASRVRHRLLALVSGYLAMIVVGVGFAVGAAVVLAPTVAGFAGAALGPLAGGVAFVAITRHGLPGTRRPAAKRPAQRPHEPTGDTDTMPYVLPKDELRRMHDGDSLAG